MNKLLKSKVLTGALVMALAVFSFGFSVNDALAASGEGTATVNGGANVTFEATTSNTYTVVLTVGASGIAALADSPTFTIPTGFTAPSATASANVGAVTVDGNWFVSALGGTCAVTPGTSAASGQVITVDVTGACATTNTITLTYKGTKATANAATPIVIMTDDVAGGTARAPIATPPTITLTVGAGEGTATINGAANANVTAGTSATFSTVLTVGAGGITATADSPTFTIPTGFTAPDATAVANSGLVLADGDWSVSTSGSCTVDPTGGATAASGQIITVDVTAPCVSGSSITVTYRGHAPSVAAAATPLVIKTDISNAAAAAQPIASSPTITVVSPAGGPTCTVDDSGGANFTTIQDAMNVAGCTTINVAAGTYVEQVTVTRSVTLNGANAGVAGNGTRGAESIITNNTASNAGFIIDTGGLTVTINGFKFTNNLPIQGQGPTHATPRTTDITFTNNFVEGGDAINSTEVTTFWRDVTISNNRFLNSISGASAVNLYYNRTSTITDNVFTNIGFGAIMLGGNDTATVTGNTITTTGNIGIQLYSGVGLEPKMVNATITNNTITGADSASEANDSGGIVIFNDTFTGTYAITDNTIASSFNGVLIRALSNITGKAISLHNNNLLVSSNFAVNNAGTGTLNAENNWWGSATGPTHASNSGGVGSKVTDRVDFNPFLLVAAVPAPTPSPSPAPRSGSTGTSRVTGGTGINLSVPTPGTGVATVAADGQVLCPNGMTLLSNCKIAPVFGPGICPNGMTIASNCTLVGTTVININPSGGPFSYPFGTATVMRGSSGEGCRAWQNFFNNRTNAGLVLDGKCGPLTMAAAVAWQSASGLVADGKLGPLSRAQANIQAMVQ